MTWSDRRCLFCWFGSGGGSSTGGGGGGARDLLSAVTACSI